MAAYVYKCDPAQFDATTQTCAAGYWAEESVGYPTLTIADAQEIGMACALLFATAWVFRRIGKAINQF